MNTTDPSDPIIAGNTALSQERWDEAMARFTEALDQGKGAPVLAHLGLGRAYQSQGRLDEAIEHFKAATVAAPDEAQPWTMLGDAYTLKRDYASAVEAYNQALKLVPVNPRVWQMLGDAERAQGDLNLARYAYETSVGQKSTPYGSLFYLNLGALYSAINWNQDAIQALRQSLAIKPGVVAYLALVQTYINMGDYASAEAVAREGQRFEFWSDLPRFALAQVYEAQGRTAEAIDSHRQAVFFNPISPAYASLVQDLRLASGSQAALAEMQALPGYKLGFSWPVLAVAQAHAMLGQIDEALREGERAWAWEPVNSQAASFRTLPLTSARRSSSIRWRPRLTSAWRTCMSGRATSTALSVGPGTVCWLCLMPPMWSPRWAMSMPRRAM